MSIRTQDILYYNRIFTGKNLMETQAHQLIKQNIGQHYYSD